jgi:two-component system sensor histidine kinase BarA
LIITKHIVEAMRGSISLNSAPGQGTCFTFNAIFELPKRAFNEDLPVYSIENKRILFFEPQEHTHYAVLAQLNDWQMQVTPCLSEEAFFEALEQEYSYDICLIGNTADVEQMPILKNYIIKARPLSDYLYLMVSTISHNMRESLVGSGADACASKPLHYRKLCEMLAAPYRLDHPDVSTDEHDQTILPLKALIADDNDANLKLLSTLLSEQIESIDTAHNGAQAVALCKSHKYDLIFMDIQMPIMDGITACKTILDSSLNEETPIIAVTAHALSGEKEQLIKDGFSDYLTKPIDEDMLKQTICDYSHSTVSKKNKSKSDDDTLNPPPFESHLLDWPLALRHAGGKTDLAMEMLNMLVESLSDTHLQLESAIENNDFALLLSVIHKFHGACCYTGVPKLKQLSETIETGLKRSQEISEVEPEILELLDELNNFKRVAQINI